MKDTRVGVVKDKCRDLAKLICKSGPVKDQVKAACKEVKIKFLKPKKSNVTRWNSAAENISSILKLKPALLFLTYHDTLGLWSHRVLNQIEFKVAESLDQILQVFKRATKLWEQQKSPTLHLVLIEIYNINDVLDSFSRNEDEYVGHMAEQMKRFVSMRFPEGGTQNMLYNVAHFLDPNLRGLVLKEYFGVYEATRKEILKMCQKFCEPEPTPTADNVAAAQAVLVRDELVQEEPNDNLTGIERLKRRKLNNNVRPSASVSRAEVELQNFESMEISKSYTNPILFWIEYKGSLAVLAQLVLEVLAIPASSSPSERAFSKGTKVQFCDYLLKLCRAS